MVLGDRQIDSLVLCSQCRAVCSAHWQLLKLSEISMSWRLAALLYVQPQLNVVVLLHAGCMGAYKGGGAPQSSGST